MLKLVLYPDPILEKIAEPVTEFDEELKQIIQEMFNLMEKENGIGLAAPQVGILKRIFVTKVDNVKIAFINPEIIESEGEIKIDEGCLSFPGITVAVPRKRLITIKAQREDGIEFKMTVTGLASVVYQHELDHLDGINFIDYLSDGTKKLFKKSLEREKNVR